jgi:hypothetical protein
VKPAAVLVVAFEVQVGLRALSMERGTLERALDQRDESLMQVWLALETTLARATVPSLEIVKPRQTVEDVMMMGLPWT